MDLPLFSATDEGELPVGMVTQAEMWSSLRHEEEEAANPLQAQECGRLRPGRCPSTAPLSGGTEEVLHTGGT